MVYTAMHRLLALPPGPISNELVESAIGAALAETDDFDWKQEIPERKALHGSDFPKDVAAMANRGGGTIVYGVAEHEKRPTGRVGTPEVDENYEQALRRAASGAITPPVLGLTIAQVGEAEQRVVVVVVPPTIDGPHLVFRNEFFGAPIRNDADTEWMRESQIERMYRARFDARRDSEEALTGLYDETAANHTNGSSAMLIAVARPRVPAPVVGKPSLSSARETLATATALLEKLAVGDGIHPLEHVEQLNLRPGLRRWVAPSLSMAPQQMWRAAWIGLHHDGAISLAATVGGHPAITETVPDRVVQSVAIESAVTDFVALIRAMSIDRTVTDFEVRVGIESENAPLTITYDDGRGRHWSYGASRVNRFVPVTATVTGDVDEFDLHRQLLELAEDCINQGGITRVLSIRPLPEDAPE